jgi:hypothetical protein
MCRGLRQGCDSGDCQLSALVTWCIDWNQDEAEEVWGREQEVSGMWGEAGKDSQRCLTDPVLKSGV